MSMIVWSKGLRWAEQQHVCGRREMNAEFRWGNLKWRDRSLGRPRRRWGDNIKNGLSRNDWSMWTGFIWLRIGISVGPLWTWHWCFKVFIPATAQHIDTKISNPIASLLHVSAYFGRKQLHVYDVISQCHVFICRIPLWT